MTTRRGGKKGEEGMWGQSENGITYMKVSLRNPQLSTYNEYTVKKRQ